MTDKFEPKYTVLWIPSWFPTFESVQNGDFILRHAQSVVGRTEADLLFCYSSMNLGQKFNEVTLNGSMIFGKSKMFCFRTFRFFKILNFINYIYYNFKGYKELYNNNSMPDLVHIHVSFRAGVIALLIKFLYGIPYIITEHWTLFNKERIDDYNSMGFFFKFVTRVIIKNASYVLPVSRDLERNLKSRIPFIRTNVIPNVVDNSMFYFAEVSPERYFEFIHVSSGKPIKNVNKIIKTFLQLKKEKPDIRLTIIGPSNQTDYDLDLDHFRKESVFFLGECTHDVVAEQMRRMNAFILFSDYETQSCVSIEALCCGLPVISSRLPCIEEFITEENGILVPPGDQIALYHAMESMVKNYSRYNRLRISKDAQLKYNPEEVGKQIIEIYDEVLAKK